MPRPPRRKPSKTGVVKMPQGFYLKKGVWYRRIRRPHPTTGQWTLLPESTGCREPDRQGAIDYVEKRNRELGNAFDLRQTTDPAKITMDELFDEMLETLHNEGTRENYECVLKANVRPFFGHRLAHEVNSAVCRAYRLKRRAEGVADTTINRELSKVSQAFKVGRRLGRINYSPPGGCDFMKDPERKNTRLVRLPDRYYSVFRDAIHPALRCFFVVDYNIGRRKDQLLRTAWEQVNFDEQHILFPSTKSYPHHVKAPFFGEMEEHLREQFALRHRLFPECPWVFFWFDLRSDKNGQRIGNFSGLWQEAVRALNARLKANGRDPIDLHVHDLRRSAHYQMRKAGIDSKTRRAIMGHKTGSMDDRYTVIDDEAFDDAIDKMNAYQKRQGMISELKELAARIESLSDNEFQQFIALRQKVTSGYGTEH
jgi:integrase